MSGALILMHDMSVCGLITICVVIVLHACTAFMLLVGHEEENFANKNTTQVKLKTWKVTVEMVVYCVCVCVCLLCVQEQIQC